MITFGDIQDINSYYAKNEQEMPLWMKDEKIYNCEQFFERKKEEKPSMMKKFIKHFVN